MSGSPQSRCVVRTRLLVYIWLGYIPRPRRAGIYRSRKGDDDDDDTFLAPVAFTSFTEEYLAGTWGREGSSCQTGGKFHAEWNLRFFFVFRGPIRASIFRGRRRKEIEETVVSLSFPSPRRGRKNGEKKKEGNKLCVIPLLFTRQADRFPHLVLVGVRLFSVCLLVATHPRRQIVGVPAG